MVVLGIDPGSATGWAIGSVSDGQPLQIIESGVERFELLRGESRGLRFLRFRNWLQEILIRSQPQLCAFEQAHHRGGAATELAVGMATRVQEECAARGIEYAPVHSGSLKKATTGNGACGKAEMMAHAARLAARRSVTDDNEADAICLAAFAASRYGPLT